MISVVALKEIRDIRRQLFNFNAIIILHFSEMGSFLLSNEADTGFNLLNSPSSPHTVKIMFEMCGKVIVKHQRDRRKKRKQS